MRFFSWLLRTSAGARETFFRFLRAVEAEYRPGRVDGRITGIRCNACHKLVNFPFPGITPEMARMICMWSGWTRYPESGRSSTGISWDQCEKCTRAARVVQ